ncbi:MAG: hypothetical protein QOG87_3657 [Actinomycetota bacterium]
MSNQNQGIVMAFIAMLMLRLSLTDEYLLFVKAAMRPWLITAGAVLALLAVTTFYRRPAATAEHGDGHAHGGPRLAFLLALPFAAVFVVTPAPLGAFAAARQTPRTPPPPSQTAGYVYPALLPPVNGAYEMGLTDFIARSLYDDKHQMAGKPIRLTGFVTPALNGSGFRLTRFVISCCAADGTPVYVDVRTIRSPAADTWVVVEGMWSPASSGAAAETPVLTAKSIRVIPQPSDPYEG